MMEKLLFLLKTYFHQPVGDGYNSEISYSRYIVVEKLIYWHNYKITSGKIFYNCYQHTHISKEIPAKGWKHIKTKDLGTGVYILDTLGPFFKKCKLLKRRPRKGRSPRIGEFIKIQYMVKSSLATNDQSYSGTFKRYLRGYYHSGTNKQNEFNQLVEIIKFLLYETTSSQLNH